MSRSSRAKAQAIRHQVAIGLAGRSPPKMGRPSAVPTQVVALVATNASMSQINGNELKPRAIMRNLNALVDGTELQQHLRSKEQRKRFLSRLRRLPVAGGGATLSAVPKVLTDNRRWMWLTYENVNRYFDGWKYFQISEGFAEDEPMGLPDGSTAEVTVTDFMKRRMSCGDETHQR
eukprot:5344189-Prymnesium_polylepis.1